MKNKKDLFALVGLLILATIFSFSYLNFKPKTALSQTTNKYTIFNTQNQGFKFMKNIVTGAYYEGESSGTNYGSADPSLIGKRFYLYEYTGNNVSDTPYPRLSCDTDDILDGLFVSCSDKVFEPQDLGTYAGDKYLGGSILHPETKQRVYKFKESVIVKAIYGDVYAPLFAATPDENSTGTQVATKEYVENKTIPRIVWSHWLTYQKVQTTEVLADHFIDIKLEPFFVTTADTSGKTYTLGTFYLSFYGIGEDGTKYVNCPLAGNYAENAGYFDCKSVVQLLTVPEYYQLVYSPYTTGVKALFYTVTLRGRTGDFVIDFCHNYRPNEKITLYWNVRDAEDRGGFPGTSDYSKLRFAVDRAWGAGTAFINVAGPILSAGCDPSVYQYSKTIQ
jgi:hypothetical protein